MAGVMNGALSQKSRDFAMAKLLDPMTRSRSKWMRKLATPPWVDRAALWALHQEAARLTKKTGVRHTVDHIWPICGKDFCGLTVPWNLQILPHDTNCRKQNVRPTQSDYACAKTNRLLR